MSPTSAVPKSHQARQFANQQIYIKEQEQLINRFRAKASKAKMAQSRIKQLDKLERIENVESDNATIKFSFKFTKQPGKTIVELKHASKSYPGDRKSTRLNSS